MCPFEGRVPPILRVRSFILNSSSVNPFVPIKKESELDSRLKKRSKGEQEEEDEEIRWKGKRSIPQTHLL
jgi:hypothetical protein